MDFSRTMTATFLLLSGLLFRLGIVVHIALGDVEPVDIPIPQNAFLGWVLISLAVVYTIPPAWSVRFWRFIKKRIKTVVLPSRPKSEVNIDKVIKW